MTMPPPTPIAPPMAITSPMAITPDGNPLAIRWLSDDNPESHSRLAVGRAEDNAGVGVGRKTKLGRE